MAEDPAMCQDDELGLCPSSGPVEIEVELTDFQRTARAGRCGSFTEAIDSMAILISTLQQL